MFVRAAHGIPDVKDHPFPDGSEDKMNSQRTITFF
jgi:hypothetical protein